MTCMVLLASKVFPQEQPDIAYLQQPTISFEEVWQRLDPKAQLRSFEKRIQRIENRITESLGLDINMARMDSTGEKMRNALPDSWPILVVLLLKKTWPGTV